MSIASELNTLSENLKDVKNAIVEMGGVLKSIGANTLVDELESIPTSDPEDPVTPWGAVMYYTKTATDWSFDADECEPVLADQDKFEDWISQQEDAHRISFDYQDGEGWMFFGMGMVGLGDDEEFEATTGIIPNRTGEWASIRVRVSTEPNRRSKVEVAVLESEEQLQGLCYLTSQTFEIDGKSVPGLCIKRFVWGTEAVELPRNFLSVGNVESISAIPDWLTEIPMNFLADNHNFDCELDLSGVKKIAQGFLAYCDSFNHPLDISGLEKSRGSLGTYFLMRCKAMTSTINVGERLPYESPGFTNNNEYRDWKFCGVDYNTSNDDPAISQGIELTGKYAQIWVDCCHSQYYPHENNLYTNENALSSYAIYLDELYELAEPVDISLLRWDRQTWNIAPHTFIASGIQVLSIGVCAQTATPSIFGPPNGSRLETLRLPQSITEIGNSFLYFVDQFHGLYGLENVQKIGDSFMGSSSVHHDLKIDLPKVTEIGDGFGPKAARVEMPVVETIGSAFLAAEAYNYNAAWWGSITLPSTLKKIGDNFMAWASRLVYSRIYVEAPPSVFEELTDVQKNYVLSTDSQYSVRTLYGTYAQEWKDALPDRTTSQPYRRLNVG